MARMTPRTLKTTTIAVLAIAAAGGAAITTAGLAWPNAISPDLAPVHEMRADQALLAQYPQTIKADRESQAALAQAPAAGNAWLRRAYVRQLGTGTLDAQALDYLEKSYQAAPLGPDVTRWRLRFIFEHWPEMTPALRIRAVGEMRNFARYHSGGPDIVRAIHNPAGRWAAALVERSGHNDALRDHGLLAKAAE
jgi:hypothetical protein